MTELTAFRSNECSGTFSLLPIFLTKIQKKLPQGLPFNHIFVQLHSLLTEHDFQYVGTLGGKVFSNNCKNILFDLITDYE